MGHIFCKYMIPLYSIFLHCSMDQLLSIEKTDLNNTLNKNPIQFDISDVWGKQKTKNSS